MVYMKRIERSFTVMVPKTVRCCESTCYCCGHQSVALFGQYMCGMFGARLEDGKRCQECLDAEQDAGDEVEMIDNGPKEVPA